MKKNNTLRRIAVFMMCAAMTLSYMPASFYAYAQDGEEAAPKEAVVEELKVEEKVAEPEKKEEAAVEEKLEKAEAQLEKEELAVAVEAEAVQAEAEEKIVEAEPAPVKPAPAKNISVKYHFYQLDASGNYAEARTISRSVSSGKSTTSIAKSTANGYVTNKKIAGEGGMVTEFTQVWKDASGSEAAFPLSMSYETAADLTMDGSNVDVSLYAQYSTHKESAKVTLVFDGIRKANGDVTSTSNSNDISWGNGWNFTKKKLEAATGLRAGQSFSCNGYKYTYNGLWKDQNGNIIDSESSISIKVKDGETSGNNYFTTDDITLTFTPVYEETMVQGLDCFFIDNISTGSGSWSNKGALYRSEFASYKHTFKDPSIATPVEHFRFLYWEMDDASERFYDGDSYSFAVDSSLPEGTVTTVKVYAYWQPSVTVNYFVNGELVESKESFDEEIAAYGFEPEAIEGMNFEGWFAGSEEDADRVAEGTSYDAPAITRDAADQKVINLYARFAEIKRVVPAAEEPASPKTPGAGTTSKVKPADAAKVEAAATIIEQAVPKAAPAAASIEDANAPLAGGTWAIINLIAAVMTALGAVIAIFRRKEEDEYAGGDDSRSKRMFAAKAAGMLAGIAAVITFIITEDMGLQMALTDKYTVVMIAMLAVQILAAALNKKASEVEADNMEAAEAAAN